MKLALHAVVITEIILIVVSLITASKLYVHVHMLITRQTMQTSIVICVITAQICTVENVKYSHTFCVGFFYRSCIGRDIRNYLIYINLEKCV